MKKLFLLSLLGFLTACFPSRTLEKFADAEKQKVAREYIQRLVDGDLAGLAAELDPKFRKGNEAEKLKEMRALIPAGVPAVVNLVGYQTSRFARDVNYRVTHQFRSGPRWIVVNVTWRENPNLPRVLTGIQVTPLDRSLQEINAFSLRRVRPARYYVVLAAAILVPLFILVTLIVCLRTKFPRRKWLWIVFILVGFGQYSFNWTNGSTGWNVLHLQLFGAGAAAASMYAPWIISVSLPVGAVAFWIKRRRMKSRERGAESAEPEKGNAEP